MIGEPTAPAVAVRIRGILPALADRASLILLPWLLAAMIGVAGRGAVASPGLGARVSASPQAERIKIGLLAPITGGSAPTGQQMVRGATLAMEQINAAGGVTVQDRGGRMLLDLIVADDQTLPEAGIQAATRLVTQDQVDIVTGGATSAVTLAGQAVVAESGTPFLIGGAATPRVTRRTDIDARWMFHYQEIGPLHGKVIATFLAEVVRPLVAPDRPLRVALIYQDTAFGEDFRLGLPGLGIMGWAESQSLPLEFVAVEKFPLGATDFRAPLTAAAAANPDVILPIGLQVEAIGILTQGIRDLGIRALWGPTAVGSETPGYYQTLGKLASFTTVETYFSTYATPRGVSGALLPAFRSAYQQRWGELPGLFAATLYDCLFIVKRAIEEAGSLDRAKVRDALEKLNMPGLTLPVEGGRIRFDGNHEVQFTLFVTQLMFDPAIGEARPRIVWPADLANAGFQQPLP